MVIDAIGSADGDLLPLADWHRLARRHRALLLVDDAHGLGVRGGGRGSVAQAGISGEPDVVTSVTLSKALGAQGGAVLGAPVVIDHLIATARSFIFDTGLNPAAAGAALAAVDIVVAEPRLADRALANAAGLARACRVPVTDSAVVPVVVGASDRAAGLAAAIRDRGIHVGCFRPPSVPAGSARLRITARANLADTDIARLRAVMDDLAPR